jgi:regulator of sigma E protease
MLNLIFFLIVIGVIVLVHEFGHFTAAKLLGIKVEAFAIGFGLPPKLFFGWNGTLFSFKKGETEYKINVLPLGGYVKLAGEGEYEEKQVHDPRDFEIQPWWKKLIVSVAGVVMNFILGALLYTVFLAHFSFVQYIPQVAPNNFPFGTTSTVVAFETDTTDPSSPIAKFHLPDTYVLNSIDGHTIHSALQAQTLILGDKGKETHIIFSNSVGENPRTIVLVPRVKPPQGKGSIGIALLQETRIAFTGSAKPVAGIMYSVDITQYNVSALSYLIGQAVATKTPSVVTKNLTGPIGVYEITGAVVSSGGVWGLINLVAVLSLAVAIMNILPLPVLDGGLAVIILIEAIIRKPINANVKNWIGNIGFFLLIILFIYICYNDISNFNVIHQITSLFHK